MFYAQSDEYFFSKYFLFDFELNFEFQARFKEKMNIKKRSPTPTAEVTGTSRLSLWHGLNSAGRRYFQLEMDRNKNDSFRT